MSLSDPGYFVFLFLIFLVLFHLGKRRAAPRFLAGCELSLLPPVIEGLPSGIASRNLHHLIFGARQPLRSSHAEKHGTLLFWLIIALLVSPLLFFKYVLVLLAVSLHGSLAFLAFPVGISFFTFASLGYLIDVYLGVTDPEPSPTRVALFVAFFPLVSAGPIERAGRFIPSV